MSLRIRVLLALGLLAGPASAAPVSGNFQLSLSIEQLVTFSISGGGTIDVSGGVYAVPAGLLGIGALVVPVTSTTAVSHVNVLGFSNLAGTFSVGGVTAQLPGELCPNVPTLGGSACNVGGSLGGSMGLVGVIEIHVIPNIVVLPFNLADTSIGQGGSTSTPFYYDAAGWTAGTAVVTHVTHTPGNVTHGGSLTTGGFSLVTPLFVAACGNVLPIFATFAASALTPVPEPAMWGCLGLVLLVASRRIRRA